MIDPPPGATAVDGVLADTRWITRSGDPSTYAPALAGDRAPMLQGAYGDRTVLNPTGATLARAGGLERRSARFRNDRTATALVPHGSSPMPRSAARAVHFRRPVSPDPDGGQAEWEIAPPLSVLDRRSVLRAG